MLREQARELAQPPGLQPERVLAQPPPAPLRVAAQGP
jgi:hypothetical protein